MSATLVAAGLDAALGEPPPACHPVVWVGRYLDRVGRALPAGPPARARVLGGLAWACGATGALASGVVVELAARRLPRPAGAALVGLVLWTTGSGRMLFEEVADVERALAAGVDEGRRTLARIVSRDTAVLSVHDVRASAIESLAENLSDSVVAPLVWYAVGGLPAACLYRFANTADAVWGYRTPAWRDAGWVTARADDLLNLVPARLTAALLAGSDRATWRGLRREAARTPSPNGGWPMGAMALRLRVCLAKPDVYQLNPGARPPWEQDTAVALRRARAVSLTITAAAAVTRSLLERRTTRRRQGSR